MELGTLEGKVVGIDVLGLVDGEVVSPGIVGRLVGVAVG